MSASADVYAMGVLMWEVYNATHVFKELSDPEVIVAVVNKRLRPVFPPDTPPAYKSVAEQCWAEIPEMRPSMVDLYDMLTQLQDELVPEVS